MISRSMEGYMDRLSISYNVFLLHYILKDKCDQLPWKNKSGFRESNQKCNHDY